MKQTIKQIARRVLNRINPPKQLSQEEIFKQGYEVFLKTGQTPHEAHMANINLFCSTNGIFNEAFNDELKQTNPPQPVPENLQGVTGIYATTDFKKINAELNEKGYVHFEQKLSKELCQRLYNYALNAPARIPPGYKEVVKYNPDKPLAEIYRLDIQDLGNNADIQQLMIDPVLVNFARNYLGCEPIFDFPAMWWSTAFQKEASDDAAQRYHFDLDRVKWLKIFFYINDVTLENGPHCYIEGSHKPKVKPAELLSRGYARIPDEDLKPYYKPEAFKVACGEAGSIFMGDTKCWHKGMPLKEGHRLALELEYTSSLFGANYPKIEVVNAGAGFKEYCLKNKTFASNIHFKN